MRRVSVTLIILLALSASLLPSGTAHAARQNVKDARGDLIAFDSDGGQSKTKIANGDVLRTKILHQNRAVVVRVKFRALKRRGAYRADVFRIVTNEGREWFGYIYAEKGNWSGRAGVSSPNGDAAKCNVKHRIRYGKNFVKIRIPRSCLSKPRWVRVGVGAAWNDGSNEYRDDARRHGEVKSQLRLGRRVRRG